jgi:hypothetical protein
MTITPDTNAKVMSGLWGLLVGVVVVMIVGFVWGGWTTTRAAQKISEKAILTSRAAICVAQFMSNPDHKTAIREFQETYSSRRSDLIEKGGWDRMPGQEQAAWGVSGACVAGLEAHIRDSLPR